MMYASDLSGEKTIASPGGIASCPGCESRVIPKCGELVTWHWAHQAKADCDTWYEAESEWHLGWKRCFPPDQVEVVLGSENEHRADVVAGRTVIEFQHSAISTTEIRERENFYTGEVGKMVWVFDARDFARNLQFRYRDAWTELPPMVALQATELLLPPIYQAQCKCGAWRLCRDRSDSTAASAWEDCWSCGTADQPKPFGPPHLGIRATRNATFRWKHRRPSQGACGQPLFWDLGNGWLFHVLTLHVDPPAAGFGRFLRQAAFLTWYGASTIPDSKAREGDE